MSDRQKRSLHRRRFLVPRKEKFGFAKGFCVFDVSLNEWLFATSDLRDRIAVASLGPARGSLFLIIAAVLTIHPPGVHWGVVRNDPVLVSLFAVEVVLLAGQLPCFAPFSRDGQQIRFSRDGRQIWRAAKALHFGRTANGK